MKEFRDASRAEAARLSGPEQQARINTMGALRAVLESLSRDVLELKVNLGTLRGELTALVGQELAERIDPIAERLAALEARVQAVEHIAQEAAE